jgi:hypothetical protein
VLDGLIAEVLEDHILEHVLDPPAKPLDPQALAAENWSRSFIHS